MGATSETILLSTLPTTISTARTIRSSVARMRQNCCVIDGFEDPPTPREVAALSVLGGVDPKQLPMWAALWLVQGFDGESIRELAGLSGEDPYDVHDLLPAALSEAGVDLPDADAAAIEIGYDWIARMHIDGKAGARWVMQKAYELYSNASYSRAFETPPLGVVLWMEDELEGGWGRTQEQLEAEVRAACLEQLGQARRSHPSIGKE